MGEEQSAQSGRKPPQSRIERRVLRTRESIQDAFVELVSERGYENVTVEDIAARADVAKATFYAHYDNKDDLLFTVFSELIDRAADRIAYREGPWYEVRRAAVEDEYQHAAEIPNLYRICLSDPRARARYMRVVVEYAEDNFTRRLGALGLEPRIPMAVMSRAFAGAHMAVLQSWLDGELEGGPKEVAQMLLDLLVGGAAWAHNIDPAVLGYKADPLFPAP